MSESILTVFDSAFPVGRSIARKAAARFYQTGWPCKRGHVALRYTSTGQCSVCHGRSDAANPQHKQIRDAYVPIPCPVCGSEIEYEKRDRQCCSRRCSNKMMYDLKGGVTCHKTCKACDGVFAAKAAQSYCTDTCRLAGRMKHHSTADQFFARLLLIRKRYSLISRQNLHDMLTRQRGLCALTGQPMTFIAGAGRVMSNASIDRIDSRIGYERSNIQLVCMIANRMKIDRPQAEFVQWCRYVVANADRVEETQ